MSVQGAFRRDENFVPITQNGLLAVKEITLAASNTTAAVPIFTVVGQVQILALYGIVTTALSSNITAAYWRLNDQTAQANITLNTGTTLSSAVAGSAITDTNGSGAALTFLNSSAGRVSQSAANHPAFQMFNLIEKNGALTQVEFVYTTTNTPASGVISFYIGWIPLGPTSLISPV